MTSKDILLDASGLYASAVRRGNTILLAGHVAETPKGDAYGQAVEVFKKIEKTLAHYGAGIKDITRLTTFVVDFRENWGGVAKVRNRPLLSIPLKVFIVFNSINVYGRPTRKLSRD